MFMSSFFRMDLHIFAKLGFVKFLQLRDNPQKTSKKRIEVGARDNTSIFMQFLEMLCMPQQNIALCSMP
jgi:hypothetical protein